MSRIVVVEDDQGISESLRCSLELAGHRVEVAHDGVKGLRLARSGAPNLILLDLMLPGMDGMEVCREIRRESSVPVIMLTARDSEVDRVLGLEIGADDYVTKPFSMRELLARIAAILRRTEGEQPSVPDWEAVGNFVFDRAARRVSLDGVDIPLARREFELLSFLLETPGRTHTRDALIDRVWGPNFDGDRTTVDVHIRWLRERFMGRAPFEIVTVRGLGYRLDFREEQKANG